jgi:hypothetical protein
MVDLVNPSAVLVRRNYDLTLLRFQGTQTKAVDLGDSYWEPAPPDRLVSVRPGKWKLGDALHHKTMPLEIRTRDLDGAQGAHIHLTAAFDPPDWPMVEGVCSNGRVLLFTFGLRLYEWSYASRRVVRKWDLGLQGPGRMTAISVDGQRVAFQYDPTKVTVASLAPPGRTMAGIQTPTDSKLLSLFFLSNGNLVTISKKDLRSLLEGTGIAGHPKGFDVTVQVFDVGGRLLSRWPAKSALYAAPVGSHIVVAYEKAVNVCSSKGDVEATIPYTEPVRGLTAPCSLNEFGVLLESGKLYLYDLPPKP